jgi:hypothetical protein
LSDLVKQNAFGCVHWVCPWEGVKPTS